MTINSFFGMRADKSIGPKNEGFLEGRGHKRALAGIPGARGPQMLSTNLAPTTAPFDGFLELCQLQIILVGADGMQVGPIKCRFIRS